MLYIGSHVSFKKDTQLVGSVKEALSYKANTFMFYTGAPQNTNRYKIEDSLTIEALTIMKKENMDLSKVIVHAPYIINLSNNKEPDKYKFSISFLQQELSRCEELGIKMLVIHPGSHVGLGNDIGITNTIRALNNVLITTTVKILIETMAGKGSEIGKTFEEMAKIIEGIKEKDKIGVCLDTCHIHDAGYNLNDFDSVLEEFDKVIGLKYLSCIHINDSKNEKETHKDRHDNFGYGKIGFDNLIKIIYHKKTDNIPKILETPYIDGVKAPYKEEIEMIRNKKFNDKLKG